MFANPVFKNSGIYVYLLFVSVITHSLLMSNYCSVWRTERLLERGTHMPVYLLFLSATAHSLMSSYRSVRRTERNVRTVNAQGAPTLIRCKPGEMNETCGPYERCSRFVTAFITHNTRILFHKAHLYKSIRCIFTCEKSLYSQSELRTAISHVKV